MPRSRNPKRQQKKNFRKMRAKREETKRREHALIAIRNSLNGTGVTFATNYPDTTKLTSLSSTLALSMLPVRSFYRMSKGTRPDQMVGTEIFSKSLYLKGTVKGLPANNSVESYVYWGWIKDRLGYTDFTTPTVSNATRSDLEDFILNQLKQHFDEKKDEMRFRENKKDNIKILGVRKLVHPGDAAYQDSVDFKCSWKTNRKIPYTRCYQPGVSEDPWAGNNYSFVPANNSADNIDMTDVQNQTGELGGDIGQNLPLNSWLPFCFLYTPQYASISPGTIQVQYNDIHYFTG